MKGVEIQTMLAAHWPEVCQIYEEGIATGNATFETTAPAWIDWDRQHLPGCRWVALDGGTVVGWAALSPVSSRCIYAGVAEVSVYVAERARGRGVGRLLLNRLITCAEQAGIWTLQAGIFPENEASIRLHERCGFRVVGRREKLGVLNGAWRDVVLMERRSTVVGVVDTPARLSHSCPTEENE